MAKPPYEETPLTEQQKQVYRYLLYQAMLDIRMLCQSRGSDTWNPFEWRRQYRRSRTAGAIADWLHNLAKYSISDFCGFNTEEFWQEYDGICRRFKQLGPLGFHDYRRRYEEHMARLGAAQQCAAPDATAAVTSASVEGLPGSVAGEHNR